MNEDCEKLTMTLEKFLDILTRTIEYLINLQKEAKK